MEGIRQLTLWQGCVPSTRARVTSAEQDAPRVLRSMPRPHGDKAKVLWGVAPSWGRLVRGVLEENDCAEQRGANGFQAEVLRAQEQGKQ